MNLFKILREFIKKLRGRFAMAKPGQYEDPFKQLKEDMKEGYLSDAEEKLINNIQKKQISLLDEKESIQKELHSFRQREEKKQRDLILKQKLNQKHRVIPLLYNARPLPYATENSSVPVNVFITPNDPFIIKDLIEWDFKGVDPSFEHFIPALYEKIMGEYYSYKSDKKVWGKNEVWEFPFELRDKLYHGGLDCLAGFTKIWTKEGLKEIKDIEVGDVVLSYNFKKEKREWKKVINKWNKGKQHTKEISFFGGHKIYATDDHEFYFRQNYNLKQKNQRVKYEKEKLSEHGFEWGRKRCLNKVPEIKKIPYEKKDIDWLNEDICRLIGYYIAESWRDKPVRNRQGKSICGHEIERYYKIMEDNDIPFSIYKKNEFGVPQARILKRDKNDIREILNDCGRTAYEKRIPKYLKNLPEYKLNALLDGIFDGDGGKKENSKIYSTVSNELANDLLEVGKRLGLPANKYFIENCGGFVGCSIYRIDFNTKSYRLRDYGYKKLSENTIISVEESDKKQVYDIEVQGNHNFILKNGVVVGNCEAWSHFITSYFIASGLPSYRVRVVCGLCEYGGHSTIYVYSKHGGEWHHLNSTNTRQMKDAISDFPTHEDARQGKDPMGIQKVWFSFSDKLSFNDFESDLPDDIMRGEEIGKQ